MITELQRVMGLLNALGDTADAVAASLRERGITGRPGSAHACPIHVYLCQELGIDHTGLAITWLNGSQVEIVWYPPGEPWHSHAWIAPGAIGAFVLAFDQGGYPDLIQPSFL